MPSGLSDAGKSLLGGLIEKNFWNRLGENGGVEEIRSHQFFTTSIGMMLKVKALSRLFIQAKLAK